MIGSNEESARGWCRRLLGERIGESVCLRQQLKTRWGNQNKIFFDRRKFKLLQRRCELLFLLGFSSSGNGFAKTTGMVAVERVRHGFGERLRAQIVCQHRRPRDRLQHGPMQAGGCDQRNHHKKFAETGKHTEILLFCQAQVKFCSVRENQHESWTYLRRQILAGGGHGKLAVFYPFGGDEFVGNLADGAGLAAHDQNFEAVVVVEMNMNGREDYVVVVVLDVRQCLLDVHLVVVIDERDSAGDVFIAEFLAMLDELVADHVGNGQRAVVVAFFARHTVELLQQ